MIKFQLLVILCYCAICSTGGRIGVDLSEGITDSSQWQSILPVNQPLKDAFALVHLQFFNNSYNARAIPIIKTAWQAGISDISVYIYPCVVNNTAYDTAPYTCPPPSQQLQNIENYLNSHDVHFRSYNFTNNGSFTSSYQYDRSIPSWNISHFKAINSSSIYLQTLYVNIEDTSPNSFFSSNHSENVAFLKALIETAESKGIEMGIYTTLRDWRGVMADATTTVQTGVNLYNISNVNYIYRFNNFIESINPFHRLKLWLPRYDNNPSMSFYTTSMADWQEVYIKQYTGGSTDSRRLGSSRICFNYIHTSDLNTTIP